MRNLLQVRLQTIFLLFFCAAVGLTTSASPIRAIEPAIQTAIVISLLQQAWQLIAWRSPGSEMCSQMSVARRFAIFWRIALAIVLGGCVIWQLLLAKQLVAVPKRENFLPLDPLSNGLPQLCVLIALCNSLVRWRPVRPAISCRAARLALIWVLGIAVGLFMVVEVTTIEFLVHRAVHNIEKRQRPKFQRPGVYINLGDEGYDAIWFGLGAMACLFAAIALAIRSKNKDSFPRVSTQFRRLLFLLLLVPPAAFCVWYYRYELPRLSPEMAVAGLALTRMDLLFGALLAAIAITVGAYRLGAKHAPTVTISDDLSIDLDRKALHETPPVLLFLVLGAGASLYYLVSSFLASSPITPMLGWNTVGHFVSLLCYPSVLLAIAAIVATIQVGWVRWRRRAQIVPWVLRPLSPQSFIEAWIMLGLLLVVGVPALRAFAFLLWFGPYNLPSLIGL